MMLAMWGPYMVSKPASGSIDAVIFFALMHSPCQTRMGEIDAPINHSHAISGAPTHSRQSETRSGSNSGTSLNSVLGWEYLSPIPFEMLRRNIAEGTVFQAQTKGKNHASRPLDT
jgi:hypothetical protein